MNRVVLLPEQVANQIAAGEVVERPASVVKELVENSLDAGANRIVVEIGAAGRGLIRVTDDGCGMSRDDALLCLERHATSKITSADDLARIQTMGFRGEAIPSIASVSRFTLTTRERQESDATAPGCVVVINGGRILEVRESGGVPGTTVEVRSLFFNVPARRKFLRSDETERAHIQHWLTTAALANPGVAFHLTMENRIVWQLPALPGANTPEEKLQCLRERLRLLLGEGLSLVAVESLGELPSARLPPVNVHGEAEVSAPAKAGLWGWIGAPGVSRATRDDQHLFVNRRPIDNRGLNAALLEGYHNVLMKGRYPLSCLFLEIDPGEVDVNIHPAKREVKFHRERAVRHFVAEATREALRKWHASHGIPPASIPSDQVPAVPRVELHLSGFAPTPAGLGPAQQPPGPVEVVGPGTMEPPAFPQAWVERAVPKEGGSSVPGEKAATASPDDHGVSPLTPPAALASPPAVAPGVGIARGADPVPLLSAPLRVIGVVGRLYILLESERGVVLLDQHAAHERVLYEQMLRRLQSGGVAPSQRLLLPETIELSPRDAVFLRENLSSLSKLGVSLSVFGERTFLLDGLPPFVRSQSPRRFALELVDQLRAAGASINAWRLGEAVVAKTVCRHAVKANDALAIPEIEALLVDLRQCDMPYTCPHGRPTLLEMSYRELDKRFGRIQG